MFLLGCVIQMNEEYMVVVLWKLLMKVKLYLKSPLPRKLKEMIDEFYTVDDAVMDIDTIEDGASPSDVLGSEILMFMVVVLWKLLMKMKVYLKKPLPRKLKEVIDEVYTIHILGVV